MKLGLVLHPSRSESMEAARALVSAAHQKGFHVVAPADEAERLGGIPSYDYDGGTALDLIVAVGGDGTVLEASRLGRRHDVPVIGVNAGTVGFLAEVEPWRIEEALDALEAGRYRISERMTLDATLPDGTVADGLNDVVVEKTVTQHVVGIAVSVAGEPLVEYRTDAVIVASPTGSTAYTFSAGGPLVDPEVEALVMTAVAPHNLFGRAIVFGAGVELEVSVVGERQARVNVDGHFRADLEPGEMVRVQRGRTPARLVRLTPRNFARTVKEKFRLHDS